MAKLPLEGVRIADFTWVWAGPYCTLQLAHLGADVIRVETRTRPCVTRLLPPWPESKPGINRSGYFNQYNQGKRSLTLNYAKPGALEVAHRLVEASDVVTNNFASGVMEKMGLGYEALRKIKPDLIMISLSGYGDTGPFHEYVAYGPAQWLNPFMEPVNVSLVGKIDRKLEEFAALCGLILYRGPMPIVIERID